MTWPFMQNVYECGNNNGEWNFEQSKIVFSSMKPFFAKLKLRLYQVQIALLEVQMRLSETEGKKLENYVYQTICSTTYNFAFENSIDADF